METKNHIYTKHPVPIKKLALWLRHKPATTAASVKEFQRHLHITHTDGELLNHSRYTHMVLTVAADLTHDFELYRSHGPNLGKDGILMPLTTTEWESLKTKYGVEAMAGRFESIYEPPKH